MSESGQRHTQYCCYGYQWWRTRFELDSGPLDSLTAIGYGGQYVFVFADLDLVVVLTGGNYDESISYAYELVVSHVLQPQLFLLAQLQTAGAAAAFVP